MLKDKDSQKLIEIFESWSILIRTLRFILANQQLLIKDFKTVDTEFVSRGRTISE
jgi:hypothetical protein